VSLTADEVARYSRHLLLPEVGTEGQVRLKNSSVVCVGSGGLGSPLLLYLAAAGVGRIRIVDHDVVDASNLQRQVLHGTAMLGRPKVHSAAERLGDLNPHVQVEVVAERIDSRNALELLAGHDVVVDGTDNFPTRYLIDDACELLGLPNVYGSIFRFEGQASVFHHEGGPGYRDLYPEPPPPGMVPSCAEAGVLGVLPGIIGTIQATEALKILLGKGTTLSGRLLLYDALAMRFSELQLSRDPGRAPVTELIDYEQFCAGPAAQPPQVPTVAPSDVAERLQEVFLLDVRAAHEADIVSLPSTALRVVHTEVETALDALPRDREVVVYCRSGVRSAKAVRALQQAGVERVSSLEGGLLAWAEQVDPALPTY
jgi:adenylyltransferase/sulfurtransferase